ncbi:MAG: LCP family protein [Longispora sp.]|nr:LCP family protein [Longispora sp. (in: high G+C Gram-positive bacteria)]
MLASSVGLVSGWLLLNRYESLVKHADLLPDGVARLDDNPDSLEGPLNLLLIGSDYRKGLENEAWRADTIMVLHIPRSLDRAFVISIPRDLRVEIPRCGESSESCVDKINAAFAYGGQGKTFDPVGGYRLLAETIHNLIGIQFDAAAIIDFQGFTKIVGALGGVQMCVDVQTVSIHTGTVWQTGCQYFNEHAALDYVRQRDFPDGDITRERHQQQFLKAILQQARDVGVLSDPMKFDRILRVASESLTLSSPHSLPALVLGLRSIRPDDLTLVKLPVTSDWIDGVSYVVPVEGTEAVYNALRTDNLEPFIANNPSLINK